MSAVHAALCKYSSVIPQLSVTLKNVTSHKQICNVIYPSLHYEEVITVMVSTELIASWSLKYLEF